jgi:hypothetical protein
MHVALLATILLVRTAAGTPSPALPPGGEAPRATDLLRAKRMADEAAARLQLRAPKRAGWARGGTGWTHPESPAAREGALSTPRKVR